MTQASIPPVPHSKDQSPHLVRLFLSRFQDNELVPVGADTGIGMAHILAVLAAPGLVICFRVMAGYALLRYGPESVLQAAVLQDRLFFLYFSMMMMAFVTALEWHALFPDSRDYLILTPLPITPQTLLKAQAKALWLFMLVLTVDANIFSTLLFPIFSAQNADSFLVVVYRTAVHALSLLAANAFVLILFLALQGLLILLLPPVLFRRVSHAVQLLLMIAVLTLFCFSPSPSYAELSRESWALHYFPPLWFLGLYQRFLDDSTAVFQGLAIRSAVAMLAAGLLCAATFTAGYWKHYRKLLETETTLPRRSRRSISGRWNLLNGWFLREPSERASFHFVIKTVLRSGRHRVFLGAYVAMGLALVLSGLLSPYLRRGFGPDAATSEYVLSIPQVLLFLSLGGMRVVFAIPAELRANWMFRLADAGRGEQLLGGVHKAMFALGIVPVLLAPLPFYLAISGWALTAVHLAYSLTLALFLLELLLLNFRKLPFTCTYLPGKANLKLRWPIYFFGFTTYAFTLTQMEGWLLRDPRRLAGFFVVALALLLGIKACRRLRRPGALRLVYAEQLPTVQTLPLGS
jgi:hypothetical protein